MNNPDSQKNVERFFAALDILKAERVIYGHARPSKNSRAIYGHSRSKEKIEEVRLESV